MNRKGSENERKDVVFKGRRRRRIQIRTSVGLGFRWEGGRLSWREREEKQMAKEPRPSSSRNLKEWILG